MTAKKERLIKGITLCPKCYESGKRSPLIYDRTENKIFCTEHLHEWIPEEWLEVIKWKK